MSTSTTITFASSNVTFSGSEIKACTITEQINPISAEAPTNTARITIFSTAANFSIVNPGGFYANLQQWEPLEITETVNGTPVYIGRFYLETWVSATEYEATFTAVDEIGIFEEIPYRDTTIQTIINGEFSIGLLIQYAIQSLFNGTVEYDIAEDLYSIPARGWLQGGISLREHLCRLALAGGAYITCSRSNKVLVKMMELGYGSTATKFDERDASITYTGDWTEPHYASAYQTTLKTALSTAVYPNTYFSFSFTGIQFKLDYLLDMAGVDHYGKFYVVIDGGTPITVEESETITVFSSWLSPILTNNAHTVTVYAWVAGTEDEGMSTINFDAITTYAQSFDSGMYDHVITGANKGIESPVEQKPLITGVEVTAHNYVYDGLGNVTVYQAQLAAGTHAVYFDKPYYDWVVTGASGVTSGTDWVEFTVTTLGTVTITAKAYSDSKTVYSVYSPTLPAGARESIIRITDDTFITSSNAQEIANRIYNYFQQRLVQKTKLFAPTDVVGDLVLIDTQSNRQISGIVEQMTTDLAGGFVSQVEIVGIRAPESAFCINENGDQAINENGDIVINEAE